MRNQVEVRLSFTAETYNLIKMNAKILGVVVTQYLKHIIVNYLDKNLEKNNNEIHYISQNKSKDESPNNPEDILKEDKENLNKLIKSMKKLKLRQHLAYSIKKRRREI